MTLLDRLNIRHPIFLAPMAGVSTPELAAEVTNQGGLGSLGLGSSSIESARAQILKTKQLTDGSFQLNFFCHTPTELNQDQNTAWIKYLTPHFEKFSATAPSELKCVYSSFLDNDDYLNLVLEAKPKAVSFHFGIPHAYQIQQLKNAGILTMVSATNLAEALEIEAAGIDIIIAQGIEAGGHRGTAFVQCKSSNANAAYRQALFNHPLTQITASISGRPARGLINHWHTQVDVPNRPPVAPYPYTYDLAKQLNTVALKNDDVGYSAFWAGSNVAQIRKLEAPDLINQLVLEMNPY